MHIIHKLLWITCGIPVVSRGLIEFYTIYTPVQEIVFHLIHRFIHNSADFM